MKKIISDKDYKDFIKDKQPKPSLLKNCIYAFFVGGLICTIGELIKMGYLNFTVLDEELASTATSITLVFLGAFLTGLGIYDDIGRRAGAGSIVPITGFANSIVSPAIEFKKEGYVFGVGAKMFSLAGPVLVYGISTSIITGLIYYFFK